MKLSIKAISAMISALEGDMSEIEVTLKKLRGETWRLGIEKDNRCSVKLLLKEHTDLKRKYDTLMLAQVDIGEEILCL